VAATEQDITELINGCLRNDRQAQHRLYDMFAPSMFGVCLRYCISHEEAEDAMMEGFMCVFQQLKEYRNEGSLKNWIRAIMVKKAIDSFRKNRNILKTDCIDAVPEPIAEGYASETAIITRLEGKEILALIRQLPEEWSIIFNLRSIEGYSFKEIATMLERNENTVRVYYQRARARLMEEIKTREQHLQTIDNKYGA
jgi:RNA polymerase sigma factor (sigma-70 family)